MGAGAFSGEKKMRKYTFQICRTTLALSTELPLVTGAMEALPAAKLCAGTWAENGKLTAPVQDFEELAQLADYVLVEADGTSHFGE